MMAEQIRDTILVAALAALAITLACFPDQADKLLFFVGL